MTQSADLNRLELGFILNPKQRRYLEAARWLRNEEPRAEGRTTLQAYVIIELAIKSPGEPIRLGADHSVDQDRLVSVALLLFDTIRRMLNTEGLRAFRERFLLTQNSLTILPLVCGHCGMIEQEHVYRLNAKTLKCPFAATDFVLGFIGTHKDDQGHWSHRQLHSEYEERVARERSLVTNTPQGWRINDHGDL